MKKQLFVVWVLFLFSLSSSFSFLIAASLDKEPQQIVAKIFDWDGNIFYMESPNYFYHKKTKEERALTAVEYAEMGGLLGKPGTEWEDFEIRLSPPFPLEQYSFRRFGDFYPKAFEKDLVSAIQKGLQGPQYNDFMTSLNHPCTASWTMILSAREHDPALFLAVIAKHLRPRYSMSQKNIFLIGKNHRIAEDKSKILQAKLDEIEAHPIRHSFAPIMASTGLGREKLHLFEFSDDDEKNVQKVHALLAPQVKQGRWKSIKIILKYTGKKKSLVFPEKNYVLTTSGVHRVLTQFEANEAFTILGHSRCNRRVGKRFAVGD